MILPTVLVIEDSPIEAKNLELSLECLGYRVIATARSVHEAKRLFREKKPDIVIIDIELGKEKLGGIEIAEYIHESPETTIVIYLTQNKDRRIISSAVKTYPSDYLPKPYNDNQIAVSIMKGIENKALWQSKLDDSIAFTGKLFIPQNKMNANPVATSVQNILYLEADGAYCNIILINGTRSRLSQNLRVVTEKLPPSLFIRIHKKYTVNLFHIEEVQKNPQKIVLMTKRTLPIGETFATSFFRWYKSVKI